MVYLDIKKFREQFPQFDDPALYPDEMIQMYWDTTTVFISDEDCPCRTLHGKQLELALNYMTAHLMTLFAVPAVQGSEGSISSTGGGFVQSATVGEVSVTKLAPPVKDAWQWWLEQSPYGAALLALLQQLAVGGMYIGGLPERLGFRKVGGVFW